MRSSERDNRGESDFNIDLDFFDWIILRELFFSQTYRPYQVRSKASSRNFLLNCFSFLFGDGDANFDLEQRRWQAIAKTIRSSDGVITAEQIAPFTGKNPVNEDQMLPPLVRFDGRPAASETGNMLYLFPALQTTASNQIDSESQTYLTASKLSFTKLDSSALIQVIALALINFIGSWFIYFQAVNIFPTLYPLLLILVIYSSLFIAVPLLRFLVIQGLNKKINAENSLRKSFAAQLTHPDKKLADKLEEAKDYALHMRTIAADDLVYDSGKDMLEQSFNYS